MNFLKKSFLFGMSMDVVRDGATTGHNNPAVIASGELMKAVQAMASPQDADAVGAEFARNVKKRMEQVALGRIPLFAEALETPNYNRWKEGVPESGIILTAAEELRLSSLKRAVAQHSRKRKAPARKRTYRRRTTSRISGPKKRTTAATKRRPLRAGYFRSTKKART